MTQEKKLFELGSIDDLFTTQEMRDEAKKPKIEEIPVNIIDQFPHHPFKIKDDESMQKLMESIAQNGVLTPVIVRHKKGGRYEMISGHRRLRACRKGMTFIPDTYLWHKNVPSQICRE